MTSSTLNPAQQTAVNHGMGPALVLSGAGSGKTRVISHRIARLIQKGTAPKRILCLTFTRKAAKEMRTRIEKQVGSSATDIMTTTFHAWGLTFLRKHAKQYLGLGNFILYDDHDRKEVLTNVLRELNIDFAGNLLRTYGEQLSMAKNNLQTVSDCAKEIKNVYQRYENFLRNRKACDFDDLLLLPYTILKEHPPLLKSYQQLYDYVLVDEYQDTNHSQYEILKLICQEHQNLMVVGDDDQSIYSWRGAKVENILNFEQDFKNTHVIRLEMNYRSSQNIIACANQVITNNKQRMDKQLIPVHQQGDKIYVFEAANPLAEAEKIVDLIQLKVLQNNLSYGNFAILYRAKHQSKPLKETLMTARIPYQAYGEISFFERKEIRDLLAFAKLLVNPNDDLSLLRIINIPRRIREVALKAIMVETQQRQMSVYQVMQLMERDKELCLKLLKPAEWEKLSLLKHFIDSYHNPSGKSTAQTFKEFIDQIEFQVSIELANEANAVKERRLNNIHQFHEMLTKYITKNPRSNLSGFLSYILIDLSENEEEDYPMVNLMTIHSAKGLEFPHVFIVGFEENLIPFFKEGFATSEEEERRLCYVALTRAQKTCTLSFCKSRKTLGGEVTNPPSRFLQEITTKNIIRDYGKFQEKPKPPTEKEREGLRNKALSRIKSLLQD